MDAAHALVGADVADEALERKRAVEAKAQFTQPDFAPSSARILASTSSNAGVESMTSTTLPFSDDQGYRPFGPVGGKCGVAEHADTDAPVDCLQIPRLGEHFADGKLAAGEHFSSTL